MKDTEKNAPESGEDNTKNRSETTWENALKQRKNVGLHNKSKEMEKP